MTTEKEMQLAIRDYNNNIKNAKAIRNCLKKSWMRAELIDWLDFIINNYKLENEMNEWIYDFCSKNHIGNTFVCMWKIYKPMKITTFSNFRLDCVKNALENWVDCHFNNYWNFDYSLEVQHKDWQKRWRYSREYHCCWNWRYYLLVDYNKAVFCEKD